MSRRSIEFQNYRNIGVSNDGKPEKFYLNSSLEREDIGELIIVIGENNVGKSNILDGIVAIKSLQSGEYAPFTKSDKPDFIYCENTNPEIKLVYDEVDEKSYDVRYFLDDKGEAQIQINIELEGKVVEVINPKNQLCAEEINAIKNEFEDKFKYKAIIENYCRRYINKTYAKDFAAIKKAYNDIMANPESIDVNKLKDVYAQLQELIKNFVAEYNHNIPHDNLSVQDFRDLDIVIKASEPKEKKDIESTLKEKYGITLEPKIVYYNEEEIKNDNLVTTPAAIKDSKFFNSLFKVIDTSVTSVTEVYDRAKEKKNSCL